MSATTTTTLAGAPSAHPMPSSPHVDIPLVLIVIGIAVLVALVATVVPGRSHPAADDPGTAGTRDAVAWSWQGGLSVRLLVVRVVAVLALVTAVVAARAGVDDELENLAPALVVGAGWPLLILASLLVGSFWRWVDPWDTLARVLDRGDGPGAPGHVYPAVVAALPWLWFLSVHPRPLDPRAVGIALAAYTALTLAGCVALGRVRWLSSAEPVGIVLSWIGLVPRRRLTSWQPPAGAGLLLGVVIAGSLVGALRRTELWSGVAALPRATTYATVGLLVACVVAGGLVLLAQRLAASPAQRAAVAQSLVPVAAGVVVAISLARNRFFTSVQILPGLLGDPLGRGWDLLGSPTSGLDPAPLGATGLVALQLGVIAGAHLLAAVIAPRPLVGDDRLPVIVTLAFSAVVCVSVVSLH